jgi:hypothetical protein
VVAAAVVITVAVEAVVMAAETVITIVIDINSTNLLVLI